MNISTSSRRGRGIAAFGIVMTAAATVLAAPFGGAVASADPCPDIEVVFARGTGEAPGVGGVGQAFVDAVRAKAGNRSVGVYAVNYAASGDFNDRDGVVRTVSAGVRDEIGHVESMAANCPNTRMVLGGYSQGAAVTGFTTAPVAPAGVPTTETPAPMSPEAAGHIAAVVLFGKPSAQLLQSYAAPAVMIGPEFAQETLDLCAPGDTICDGTTGGGATVAHALYPFNGLVDQSATFAVDRL